MSQHDSAPAPSPPLLNPTRHCDASSILTSFAPSVRRGLDHRHRGRQSAAAGVAALDRNRRTTVSGRPGCRRFGCKFAAMGVAGGNLAARRRQCGHPMVAEKSRCSARADFRCASARRYRRADRVALFHRRRRTTRLPACMPFTSSFPRLRCRRCTPGLSQYQRSRATLFCCFSTCRCAASTIPLCPSE